MFMEFLCAIWRQYLGCHSYPLVIVIWAARLFSIPQVSKLVQDVLAAELEKSQPRDKVIVIDCSASSVS